MTLTQKQDRHYDPRWISLFLFLAVCATIWIHQLTTQMVDHTPDVSFSGKHSEFSVSYLDVGDGDCILLKASTGESLLMDTEKRNMRTRILEYLEEMKVSSLDYLMLTHYHDDHAGSAAEILSYLPVKTLLVPNFTSSSPLAKEILETAQNQGSAIQTCHNGGMVSIGNATLTFLADGSQSPEEENGSVVSLLRYGNKRFLFTGDAEKPTENLLLDRIVSLKADVLKVAHHGSSSSTGKEFLHEVSPEFAIISVDKENPYRLPSAETVLALEEQGCKIFYTDNNGRIRIVTDGEKIKVFSEK